MTRFDAMRICIQHYRVVLAMKILHFDPISFGGRVSKRCSIFAWRVISMIAYAFKIRQGFIKVSIDIDLVVLGIHGC